MIKYTQFNSAREFLSQAEPLLVSRESEFNLMLGLSILLQENPFFYSEHHPLFAVVSESEDILAAALMTPPYKLQINACRRDQTQSMEVLAKELYARNWPVPAVLAERETGKRFADAWCRRTGSDQLIGMAQRIHELTRVIPPPLPSGHFQDAKIAHRDLILKWSAAFHKECFGDDPSPSDIQRAETALNTGRLVFWMDPHPVSMATRTRPTPNTECVSFVFTPPELRGKGYASALVAALSQHILNSGKSRVTLFTDLSNPTSNHIYRNLGYQPIADVVDIHFDNQ